MVAAVAAMPVAAAVPALAMVAVTVVAVGADAAHARTPATHKAARAVSPHKHATRMHNPHVSSKHGPNMTTMPNPPAMSLQASHLQASQPAATVVASVAGVPLAAAVADHARVAVVAAVAVQAAAATPALSTAVKPRQRPHILVRPFNIGLLTRFGFAGLFRTSARLSP